MTATCRYAGSGCASPSVELTQAGGPVGRAVSGRCEEHSVEVTRGQNMLSLGATKSLQRPSGWLLVLLRRYGSLSNGDAVAKNVSAEFAVEVDRCVDEIDDGRLWEDSEVAYVSGMTRSLSLVALFCFWSLVSFTENKTKFLLKLPTKRYTILDRGKTTVI